MELVGFKHQDSLSKFHFILNEINELWKTVDIKFYHTWWGAVDVVDAVVKQ